MSTKFEGMSEQMFKVISSFAVPKGTIYFVPEVELRRTFAPDETLVREELVYWKQGAAVITNVGEPEKKETMGSWQ